MDLKNNEVILKKEIEKLNYKVGAISESVNILTKKALQEVISNLDEEWTDVFVTIENKLYVVEIATCDNEKDIQVYTDYKYFAKYGNLEECYENDSITEKQYKSLKNWLIK